MNLSRRSAIKGVAVGTIAAAAAGLDRASSEARSRGTRYGMVVDLGKCFGCHACSVACKAEQDVPLGFFKSWVIQSEKGQFPKVSRRFLPVLCNQCDDPPPAWTVVPPVPPDSEATAS